MPKIELNVENKIVSLVNLEDYIVCHNGDYVVEFSFDEEWSNVPIKTVRFYYGNEMTDVVVDNNSAPVPELPNVEVLEVGVFSGNDYESAKLKSTTSAYINCKYSIIGKEGTPKEPNKDVYAEIIALLNKYIEQGGGAGGITESEVVEIINENIAGLQPKTDEELQTISKEIVGAINEINEKAGQGGGVVEETDPTVPTWAKEPNKPTYTWEEIKDKPSFDIPPDYELIEKVVIGYSITTNQPADWASNYTAYFTNEGTDRNPVYVKVSDTSAPAWEIGKYYSFDGTTKVKFKRTNEPNGDAYRLKKFLLYTNSAQGEQVNGYLAVKTDYKSPESHEYGAQVNINRWNTTSANYVLAEGVIENGRLNLRGGNTSGLYSLGLSNIGSLIFGGTSWYDKEANAKYITSLESTDAILPNTEIYVYGVRYDESIDAENVVFNGSSQGEGTVYKAYHLEAGEGITQDILMEKDGGKAPEGELEIWSYMPFTISYPKYDYTHIEDIYYFKAFYFTEAVGNTTTVYKSRDALVCTQSGKFEYASNGNPNDPFTLTLDVLDSYPDSVKRIFVKYTPAKEVTL